MNSLIEHVPNGSSLLTHSRMDCAKSCLRKHYYKYEAGLRRDRTEQPLRIGSAIHHALDLLAQSGCIEEALAAIKEHYQVFPTFVEADDWLNESFTCMVLLAGYHRQWSDDGIKILATEQAFELPLVHPETGKVHPHFKLAGKIDKIARLPDGRLAVIEHKTTSDPIDDESDYWRRLHMDQQISLYFLAARALGYDVQTVLYDVIKKPQISRFRATPEEKRKYKKNGELYAKQHECDEPPEQFGARFNADIKKRPEFYFARKEIPRLDSDLEHFQHELWQIADSLQRSQQQHGWFRNTSACIKPFKCEFLDMCLIGHYPVMDVPDGYVQLNYVHPELKENEDVSSHTSSEKRPAA